MAYTVKNYKTKKSLKEDLKDGISIPLQPGNFGPTVKNGEAFLEGPHYPAPHTWYAHVAVRDGKVVKVIN